MKIIEADNMLPVGEGFLCRNRILLSKRLDLRSGPMFCGVLSGSKLFAYATNNLQNPLLSMWRMTLISLPAYFSSASIIAAYFSNYFNLAL